MATSRSKAHRRMPDDQCPFNLESDIARRAISFLSAHFVLFATGCCATLTSPFITVRAVDVLDRSRSSDDCRLAPEVSLCSAPLVPGANQRRRLPTSSRRRTRSRASRITRSDCVRSVADTRRCSPSMRHETGANFHAHFAPSSQAGVFCIAEKVSQTASSARRPAVHVRG